MKDERIQTTVNRFAARGFFIWYLLMSISIFYRALILKQHIRDFWDIFAIFIIGTFYVFIAYANKGVLDHGFKRRWLTICISAFIGVFTWQFIAGPMHSVVEMGAFLIVLLPTMGLVIGIAYFLNRRWKRKEGIEDEK
jgi:energy-coupling factor transporter transmembrane protein EcfT